MCSAGGLIGLLGAPKRRMLSLTSWLVVSPLVEAPPGTFREVLAPGAPFVAAAGIVDGDSGGRRRGYHLKLIDTRSQSIELAEARNGGVEDLRVVVCCQSGVRWTRVQELSP